VASVARNHGIPLIIRNTLATPYLLRPIEHGADIVVHSASKFSRSRRRARGRHRRQRRFDAARSGALFPHLSRSATASELRGSCGRPGEDRLPARGGRPPIRPTPSPLNAFLIGQGIETLSLRVERQSRNSLELASWLEQQPEVHSVDYAGLASNPFHALAQRYLPDGQGSVFSFTLRGGLDAARAFVNALEVFTHMTHSRRRAVADPAPGDDESQPAHRRRAEPGRHLARHVASLVGIEDIADLIVDAERGLAAVRRGIDEVGA